MPIDPKTIKWDDENLHPDNIKWENAPDKTSFGEDLKTGLVSMVNAPYKWGALVSGAAAGYAGLEDTRDNIFRSQEENEKKMYEWANPKQKEQGLGGKIISAPFSIPTFAFSPAGVGEQMIKQGESTPRAIAGTGLATAGNVAAAVIPGAVGVTAPARAVTGAAINAGQQYAQQKALQQLSTSEEGKKAFEPSLEDLVAASIVGAGVGVASKPTRQTKIPSKDVTTKLQQLAETKAQQPDQAPLDPGQKAFERLVEDQTTGWNEPIRNSGSNNGMDTIVDQLNKQNESTRTSAAQETINARQTALEQEVARQQALDFNAAERARQEQAPTGYGQWAENLRQNVQGDRGNNSPVDMVTPEMELAPTPYEQQQSYSPDNLIEYPKDNSRVDQAQYVQKAIDEKAAWEQHNQQQALEQIKQAQRDTVEINRQQALWEQQSQMEKVAAPDYGQGPKTRAFNRARWNKQSGKIDFDAISEEFKKGLKGAQNLFKLPPQDTRQQLISNTPGFEQVGNLIAKPVSTDVAIDKLRMQGNDISPMGLSGEFRQGPELTGEWNKSPVLKYVSSWGQWAEKAFDKGVRDNVTPIERTLSKFSTKDMLNLHEALKVEAKNGVRFTPEEIGGILGEKHAKVYQQYRQTWDNILSDYNKSRAASGEAPVKASDVYNMAGRFGDWHLRVTDTDGKLVAYVRGKTRGELQKALAYMKKNVKPHTDKNPNVGINWNKMKPEYMPSNLDLPRDVLGAAKAMHAALGEASPLKDVLESVMENKTNQASANSLGVQNRFKTKHGILGAEGDMPWLSPEENAQRFIESQIQGMKTAYRWNALQEASSNVSRVLSDKTLLDKVPNTLEYAQKAWDYQMGKGQNLTRAAEQEIGKWLGRDASSIRGFFNTSKSMAFMMQLGVNAGHVFATILTPLNSVALAVRELGLGAFSPKAMAKTLYDATTGMNIDIAHELLNKDIDIPMTPLGKEAIKYAEDNGVTLKRVFSNHYELGKNNSVAKAMNGINATFSIPEKISRLATFMGFVHALDESGKYAGDNLSLFQRAEELTQMSQVNFRAMEKPIIASKLGVIGTWGYMYKAPMFNYFQNLNGLAGEFLRNPKTGAVPLTAHLGMTALLGGVAAMPLVNELDSVWNLIKETYAEWFPTTYQEHLQNPIGPKLFLARMAPEGSAWEYLTQGVPSKLSGVDMRSHFTPNLVDLENPWSNISSAPSQDLIELAGAAEAIAHPTNTSVTQAVYDNSWQGLKGYMETNMDRFKVLGEDGKPIQRTNEKGETETLYQNPKDLVNRRGYVWRTSKQEAIRSTGMRALDESNNLQLLHAVNAEASRTKQAIKTSVARMYDAIKSGNGAEAEKYAKTIVALDPEADFDKIIENKAIQEGTTPAERTAIHSALWSNIQKQLWLQQNK